jgi:hypothetical protein
MNVAGGRPEDSGSRPDVAFEVAEREIVPGETARFPFTVPAERGNPSIHDFDVASDNPEFSPAWARIVRSTDSDALIGQYSLEIRPEGIRRSQYGIYPLRLSWAGPGVPRSAEGRCTLEIRPCVRLTAQPSLKIWPAGEASLTLENCGGVDLDVSISVTHHGSNWSKGWEFELTAEDGPFEFSETFDPPAGARRGEFELDVSAEGISLIRMPVTARSLVIPRKLVITAIILLAGAAVGITLAAAGAGPALAAQAIVFTSAPATDPVPGDTYHVAAKGGASGNPVIFTIASPSASVCLISGSAVTFNQPGRCIIDANEAGSAKYQPAPQMQQAITVGGHARRPQSITFAPPASGAGGGSAALSATGGGSGNPVVFTVDPSTASGVCSVSGADGATVNYAGPGRCVIDANEDGDVTYAAAPQVRGTITVGKIPQSISFAPPASGSTKESAALSATGGGSGNPVVFTVDSSTAPGVCSVSGADGATVNYAGLGACVIDANQAGNATYAAAPRVQGTITVGLIPQSISFVPPASGSASGSAPLSATGGGSGNPVVFTVDPSTESGVCRVSGPDGATVIYGRVGSCVIDANQAGNAVYAAAGQVQQAITVEPRLAVSRG